MNHLARFILVAVVAAAGTWLGGWWTVPIIAFAAGWLMTRPTIVSAACATAWLALLMIDVIAAGSGRLIDVLAGVMGLPAPALFAATLALPALLGWSAASLGWTVRHPEPLGLSSRAK